MSTPELENALTRLYITAIGKALVKKGVLSIEDITSEMSGIRQEFEGRPDSRLQEIATSVGDLINAVQSWK
ncbi:hypothetical protein [Oecophyllibacter saccharovorans]|uniref:Uncharacterized protein n=1 Tax=Oecophyllibacter saccharovorans TaxID=2558360 RepID=A0A506UKS5_9PROT|nr:hypothetical protein [Oecophyllibacter saccharovorans]QDH15091.1 hypothetical protein E3E11_03530 [Oecophyllibacter saccharovorans]TPW33928.1 hypothetical protein E3202_04905 [Oecophyllibacter saccharovorans]TPW35269.1 hypothetical protein E3203_07420 [Oecophyllibacter saccharovorans]